MPREKRSGALDSCLGLLALISRAYRNFSLWHHEFIKAIYQERSTCGFELMRFIPTMHCSGYQERSACGSELMRCMYMSTLAHVFLRFVNFH